MVDAGRKLFRHGTPQDVTDPREKSPCKGKMTADG
jgi:hypothetical protein